MIEPVAELVGVSKDRIYANTVFFEDDGTYKGFCEDEPTSRSGGKPKVVGE
jgi:phosphoserine phosphatase